VTDKICIPIITQNQRTFVQQKERLANILTILLGHHRLCSAMVRSSFTWYGAFFIRLVRNDWQKEISFNATKAMSIYTPKGNISQPSHNITWPPWIVFCYGFGEKLCGLVSTSLSNNRNDQQDKYSLIMQTQWIFLQLKWTQSNHLTPIYGQP
jgi:hypothetical protein